MPFFFSVLARIRPLDFYTVLGLTLTFLGFVVGLIQLRQSFTAGNKLIDIAVRRLTEIIRSRAAQPSLLTANALRSVALGLQLSLNCPVLTDRMIATSIRLAALELETQVSPATLKRRLEVLSPVLLEFEPHGVPLLSIASEDRMIAYLLSVITMMVTILALTLALALSGTLDLSIPTRILIWILVCAQWFITVNNMRAAKLWREAALRPDQRLRLPHRVLDLFLYQAHSTSRSVHTVWAPLWENNLLFGLTGLSYLAVSALLGAKVAWWVAIAIGSLLFSLIHLLKRNLGLIRMRRRCKLLYRDLRLIQLGYRTGDSRLADECLVLCRQLYAITGSETYREMEKAIRVKRED